MITSYDSFINTPNLLDLSEGIQAKLGMQEFSYLFEPSLFESKTDDMILEKAYGTYELGLLYESRKSWFEDETPIYMLEGKEHKILFKENSMFIISNATYQILNEDYFEDALNWGKNQVTGTLNNVKNAAKSAVNTVATVSKAAWDDLSAGAKKVYEFGKRIVSAAAEFLKANPLTAVALGLQIISILCSFFPPVGIWASPICLALSGMIEIYEGSHHLKEAYTKLSEVEPNKIKRSAEAFAVGGPLLIAGMISLVFGVHDIITSPTAGSGVGPIASMGGKKAAEAWGKTFISQLIHNFEHFMEKVFGKAVTKIGLQVEKGLGKFLATAGSKNAATLISIFFTVVGKHILGGGYNLLVQGLGGLSKAFSFVLGIPTKISLLAKQFSSKAETPGGKIIAEALDSFVTPCATAVGKFIDTNIKPSVDGATAFFNSLVINEKELSKFAESTELQGEKVEIAPKQIKPKGAVIKNEEAKAVSKLPKVTQKTPKVKEGLNHIQVFENFKMA